MTAPRRMEGWDVPARPAALAMAGLLTFLVVTLVGGGLWYDARFAPRTHARLASFPEPRLQTVQHPPGKPIGLPPPRPARIEAAMRAVVAQGDALWGPRR